MDLWDGLEQVRLSCCKMNSLMESIVWPDLKELGQVISEAMLVSEALSAWKNNLPESWRCKVIESPMSPKAFRSRFYTFSSLSHTKPWIAFWCGRIRLLQSLCRLTETALLLGLPQEQAPTPLQFQQEMLQIVDDICASTPFILGEMDAYGNLSFGSLGRGIGAFFLVRCLHVANSVNRVPPNQRAWILDTMQKIGHRWGIRSPLRARAEWLDMHGQNEELWP